MLPFRRLSVPRQPQPPGAPSWVSFESPREVNTPLESATAAETSQPEDFASFSTGFFASAQGSASLPCRNNSEPPSYFAVSQQSTSSTLQHSVGKRFDSEDPSGRLARPGSATWSPWTIPKETPEAQKASRKYSLLSSKNTQDTNSFKDMMRRAWLTTPPAFCNLRLPPIRATASLSNVNCMTTVGNELFVGVATVRRGNSINKN